MSAITVVDFKETSDTRMASTFYITIHLHSNAQIGTTPKNYEKNKNLDHLYRRLIKLRVYFVYAIYHYINDNYIYNCDADVKIIVKWSGITA